MPTARLGIPGTPCRLWVFPDSSTRTMEVARRIRLSMWTAMRTRTSSLTAYLSNHCVSSTRIYSIVFSVDSSNWIEWSRAASTGLRTYFKDKFQFQLLLFSRYFWPNIDVSTLLLNNWQSARWLFSALGLKMYSCILGTLPMATRPQ